MADALDDIVDLSESYLSELDMGSETDAIRLRRIEAPDALEGLQRLSIRSRKRSRQRSDTSESESEGSRRRRKKQHDAKTKEKIKRQCAKVATEADGVPEKVVEQYQVHVVDLGSDPYEIKDPSYCFLCEFGQTSDEMRAMPVIGDIYMIIDKYYDKVSVKRLVGMVQQQYDTKIRVPQKQLQELHEASGTTSKIRLYKKWSRDRIWAHFTEHEDHTGLQRWQRKRTMDNVLMLMNKHELARKNEANDAIYLDSKMINTYKKVSDFIESMIKKNLDSKSK